MNDELKKLMDRVHVGITSFNYKGANVPSIILPEKRYYEIKEKVAGKPFIVEPILNFPKSPTPGHVFVEMVLKFSEGEFEEKILLYVNESMEFFESLANTSMIALISPHSQVGSDNVLLIQLPRPEKIANVLDIIKKELKNKD